MDSKQNSSDILTKPLGYANAWLHIDKLLFSQVDTLLPKKTHSELLDIGSGVTNRSDLDSPNVSGAPKTTVSPN